MDVLSYILMAWGFTVQLLIAWITLITIPTIVSGLIFFAILGALVWALKMFNRWKRKTFYQARAMRMNPTQKALLMKQIMSQGIHDAFFDAWCEGQISQDDYMRECQVASNIFDLGDLVPRQRKLLKRAIKDRVKSSKVGPKPIIPGEPPLKTVTENNFDAVVALPAASETFMESFMNRFKKVV